MAKRYFPAAVVFGIVASTSLLAKAATFNSFTSKDGNVVAMLSGEIAPGDADQLSAIIRDANRNSKFLSGVRLNSLGGNLAEGVKIADVIRLAKIATVVPAGATCASACFVAFAAGAEKYVSNNAYVGVHGASENGAETASSSAATITMARIAKDLGVPSGVLGKMVVTPPSEVVWLTPNDLRAMGTTMTGKPQQLARPSVPAQQLPGTAPPTGVQAAIPPTWEAMVKTYAEKSAEQNGGKPAWSRVCQPTRKVCNTGLFFKNDAGVALLLREEESVTGQTTAREICRFNSYSDVRTCFDYDKHSEHIDMKDAGGEWTAVERK